MVDMSFSAKPTVSVVIPIYNAEKYIEGCVKSIQNQTYMVSEIFLINDGSTDSSLEIINKLAIKDRRIKIMSQDNSGPSKARNIGMLASTSDIIALNDADDEWVSDKLEKQINLLLEKEAEVSFSNLRIIDNNGEDIREHRNDISSGSKEDIIKALIYCNLTMMTSTAVFYRSLISKNCLFNEKARHYEDVVFFINITSKAKTVLCTDILVIRRQHANSTSISLNIENVLNSMRVCSEDLIRLGHKKYISYFRSYVFFAVAHFSIRSSEKIKSMKYNFKSIIERPSKKNIALMFILFLPFSELIFNKISKLKGF